MATLMPCCLARVLLREPSWPQRAAAALGADAYWAPQYVRGQAGA